MKRKEKAGPKKREQHLMRITFVVRSDADFSNIPFTLASDTWWTELIKKSGIANVVAVTVVAAIHDGMTYG